MKLSIRLTFLFLLVSLTSKVFSQDPNVSVYFANPVYVSSNVYRFDVMVQATGSTSSFQLRTFQAGIYVNPTWVNGGTIYIDNMLGSLAAPGYNGAFQWNATDKLINCSVNTGVRTASGCVSTTIGTTPLKIATIQLSNSVNFLSCASPNLRFNYVQNASPLRLRTSVSWRSGTGCTANYDLFYPNRTFTGQAFFNSELYSTADADGASPVQTAANAAFCYNTMNLTAFLEGYYVGGSSMQPCLFFNNVARSTMSQADTITVELHPAANPSVVASKYQAILNTDGTAQVPFLSSLIGQSHYIVIKHRNSIETWSANPVTMAAATSYNFSNASNKALGNNMSQVEPGVWAMYSGDIADPGMGLGYQDGVVESTDYSEMENAVYMIETGYIITDLTGDGVVESSDYSLMENNAYLIVSSIKP